MTRFVFTLLAVFALISCSNSDEDREPSTYRHTTIIYMSAQNDLGYNRGHIMDSTEIVAGSKLLNSNEDNVLIYMDDAFLPRIYQLRKSFDGKCKLVKRFDSDLNSSDPKTLQTVLEFARTNYPSKSYGLTLWSHGTGWLPYLASLSHIVPNSTLSIKPQSFGIDVNPGGNMYNNRQSNGNLGDQMTPEELAKAIKDSQIDLTYIFFDACFMQCIEVAWALRNSAKYIIGSPASTSGYGAYYADFLPNALSNYPFNDESIKSIANTYFYDVMENPASSSLYVGQGCIQSVIKTSELPALAQATAIALKSCIQGGEFPDLGDAQTYTRYDMTNYPDFYDISSVFHKLLPKNDYETWRKVAEKCIIHTKASDEFFYFSTRYSYYTHKIDKETAIGVSMFFPKAFYDETIFYGYLNQMFKDTEWYSAVDWKSTGW